MQFCRACKAEMLHQARQRYTTLLRPGTVLQITGTLFVSPLFSLPSYPQGGITLRQHLDFSLQGYEVNFTFMQPLLLCFNVFIDRYELLPL